MTLEEAKVIVHAVYPEAYHMGHGTANRIASHRIYVPGKGLDRTKPPVKYLSQTFVIFLYLAPRGPNTAGYRDVGAGSCCRHGGAGEGVGRVQIFQVSTLLTNAG